MELKNFKENYTLVTDQNDKPFALDHSKYPNFLLDHDEMEYEVFQIDGIGNVNDNIKVKKKKMNLTARFIKLVPPSKS